MKSALALMAAAAAVSIPAMAAAQTNVTIAETAPVVTLNVTETVEAAPDQVVVGTGVQTRAPTAAQAMRDNAAKMDRLITTLAKAGIATKDIQTSGAAARHAGRSGRDQCQRTILFHRRPDADADAGAGRSLEDGQGAGGFLRAGGRLSLRTAPLDRGEQ